MSSAAVDTKKSAAADSGKPKKARLSDRAKAERNLGWKLAGPAFVVMVLVTMYPILNALYLSFFKYRLTDPAGKKFVGLQNYVSAFKDSLFWEAMWTTLIITLVTVVVELILGFAIAMLMNKIVMPRRTLRTVVLLPYAIITVVSAFAWKFGFDVSTGFVNHWLHTLSFGSFPLDYDWFGQRWSALFVICLSEIWKTTPFMSLLLLTGLAPGRLLHGGSGQGRRRHVVAAPHEGDPAEHEGRHHGRPAVPHARRLPHLRQPVRHDRRCQQDDVPVDARLA